MSNPAPIIITVPCVCAGQNPVCSLCNGIATVAKVGCRRCGGTGFEEGIREAGTCVDCKGRRYREIDNTTFE